MQLGGMTSCTTVVILGASAGASAHTHLNADMIRNVALIWAAVVASHLCLALPIADPEPDPIHRTHVRIHIPHEVHTVHHHHVEKVPIFHEVPVIKEVPVVHTVPVVKPVPVLKTVHVPVINTHIVEKPVFVPYKDSLSLWH